MQFRLLLLVGGAGAVLSPAGCSSAPPDKSFTGTLAAGSAKPTSSSSAPVSASNATSAPLGPPSTTASAQSVPVVSTLVSLETPSKEPRLLLPPLSKVASGLVACETGHANGFYIVNVSTDTTGAAKVDQVNLLGLDGAFETCAGKLWAGLSFEVASTVMKLVFRVGALQTRDDKDVVQSHELLVFEKDGSCQAVESSGCRENELCADPILREVACPVEHNIPEQVVARDGNRGFELSVSGGKPGQPTGILSVGIAKTGCIIESADERWVSGQGWADFPTGVPSTKKADVLCSVVEALVASANKKFGQKRSVTVSKHEPHEITRRVVFWTRSKTGAHVYTDVNWTGPVQAHDADFEELAKQVKQASAGKLKGLGRLDF